jgi:hypothetical protein
MASNKRRIISLSALALVLLLIVPLSSAAAQDEDERGVDVVAGPHAVRVVLVNSNLAAGFVKMVLFVTNAETGEPVPDASVVIRSNNEEDDLEGWAIALNSPNMPERYDVRMNLDSTGEWLISVDVSSSLGQGGATAMTLEVPSFNRNTQGSLVFFGVFAVVMLGVAYLIWSTRRNNRRRRESAQGESQG